MKRNAQRYNTLTNLKTNLIQINKIIKILLSISRNRGKEFELSISINVVNIVEIQKKMKPEHTVISDRYFSILRTFNHSLLSVLRLLNSLFTCICVQKIHYVKGQMACHLSSNKRAAQKKNQTANKNRE